MSRRLIASLVALLVALALPASALAQDYLFRVDKETVDVSWNADGTESIEYSFTFTPQPGSHPIDFVDVGMPVSQLRPIHRDRGCRRQSGERLAERLPGQRLGLCRGTGRIGHSTGTDRHGARPGRARDKDTAPGQQRQQPMRAPSSRPHISARSSSPAILT